MNLSLHDELILLALLASVGGLMALVPLLRIPYPILLVIGGLVLGLVPGLPAIDLPPEAVLVIALPPLLYGAAFFTSLRDFRANLRPIMLLAIGLVAATMGAVAVVAHYALHLGWGPACVLGAIVSPTDPVAATAIASRLGVPRRVVTVLEGESLTNDWTALIGYRFAVAAVLTGHVSAAEIAWRLPANALGGVAIGLAVGWLVAHVRRRLDWPPGEITISILSGYFAYLPAEAAGVSAVLAVVTAGIYLGWRAPELTSPTTRMQGQAVWELLVFLVNSALFVLIGLQLRPIVDRLTGVSAGTLVWYGFVVSAVVIAIRIAWVFPFTYLPRRLVRYLRERDDSPPRTWTFLVAWTGMRGAVSLAAALAIPLQTDAGQAFPGRDLIVFVTFCVILVTMLVQGLSLPALIRVLRIPEDGAAEHEEVKARVKAAEAALRKLEELVEEDWVRDDTAERLRGLYDYRVRRFRARLDGEDGDGIEQRSADFARLRRQLLDAERDAVVRLRNDGWINDEVMHRVERDIDLEVSRLDA